MTSAHRVLCRFKSLWLTAWPLWALLVFASLATARLLPGGYARATLATPILLMAPGSLTLGAVFSKHRRPRGTAFVCYSALLSAIWSGFASLLLYVLGILITADSTYWCLLAVSAVLAIMAEARLLLGRPEGAHRTGIKPRTPDPDPLGTVSDAEAPVGNRASRYYAIVAVATGISLLGAGLYVYDRHPRPTSAGYTWMAWTSPQIKDAVAVGPAGTELHFQIVHRQPGTTTFRLSAAWLGTPSRPLARTLTLSIGPNRTFKGALFVPPLPNGCTYRIAVSLTPTSRQVDPLTRKLPAWSINADVYAPGKSLRACKR